MMQIHWPKEKFTFDEILPVLEFKAFRIQCQKENETYAAQKSRERGGFRGIVRGTGRGTGQGERGEDHGNRPNYFPHQNQYGRKQIKQITNI